MLEKKILQQKEETLETFGVGAVHLLLEGGGTGQKLIA